MLAGAGGQRDVQDQQGDRDGEHAVAEGLKPSGAEPAPDFRRRVPVGHRPTVTLAAITLRPVLAHRLPCRSGQDLGLLALELFRRDDAPVAQVSELGQLVRCVP